MPTHRLTSPDSVELLEADSARRERIHTVLRGTAYVMGRPRGIVVRRVPSSVVRRAGGWARVEVGHSWATP